MSSRKRFTWAAPAPPPVSVGKLLRALRSLGYHEGSGFTGDEQVDRALEGACRELWLVARESARLRLQQAQAERQDADQRAEILEDALDEAERIMEHR